MATAEQIKSLIRSHLSENPEQFYTVALQVAAHEAQQGHGALAHDIRNIIDKTKRTRGLNVIQFPKDLTGLVFEEKGEMPTSALVLPVVLKKRIDRVVHEYHQQNKLKSHGLCNRRKILLAGPPGTGKTMTARVLSHELQLPLFTIQVDKVVTKFMGETSTKLRQIFDLIRDKPGVYLFDEFDAIGGERSKGNDVGEMRRVLNALLQFIEADTSDSIIVAATNMPQLLDKALFRRFDDVLYYEIPNEKERRQLMRNILGTFVRRGFEWTTVIQASQSLSHAEIDYACRDSIKEAILSDTKNVTPSNLLKALEERRNTHLR